MESLNNNTTQENEMTKTTTRKYATKAQKFAEMLAEAKKWERAAIQSWDANMTRIGDELWLKANELFAAANAYSIRWSLI